MGYQEHTLLPTQWDAVFLAIEEVGFDPREFDRSTAHSEGYDGEAPLLTHKPSGAWFFFDFEEWKGRHSPRWNPGEEKPVDGAEDVEWKFVLIALRTWLRNVERELSSPNLWALLDQQHELLAATEPTGDTANTPFSPEEQQQIAAQLNEIKQLLVSGHGADPKMLEARIEELEEASTRLGRRDWLLMFLGVSLTWTLEGLIPPEGLQEVLMFAAHTLGHLFGGGVPQLPMP